MQFEAQRAYLLEHFQEYRIIQPTVIFLHGLPTALSRKHTLANELQRIGNPSRINVQTAGKDFFTAFVEFHCEIPAALAIMVDYVVNAGIGRKATDESFAARVLWVYKILSALPKGSYLSNAGMQLRSLLSSKPDSSESLHVFTQDQAKDIDHRAVAAMFLSQDCSAAQLAIDSITRAKPNAKFILPIDADNLMRQLCIKDAALGACEQETEQIAEKEGEWGVLSTQIEAEVSRVGESQRVKRTRIQQFLDGAERFLTKLIFQSSEFMF